MRFRSSWYNHTERVLIVIALILVGIWSTQQLNWLDLMAELLNFWQWGKGFFANVVSSLHVLLFPSVLGVAAATIAIHAFPSSPPVWVRVAVSSIVALLGLRYLTWRLFITLNFSDFWNGSLSLLFLAIDIAGFVVCVASLCHMSFITNRSPQADRLSKAVIAGTYCPWVDVWIPTYNEPVELLRRTIIGCQAMDYANKRVYLLDDKRRPAMRSLAEELGCVYICRPDNRHAKAGNLNHAMKQTQGELIVSFDADFIPTREFLTRTVGFFQDPQVALVQTPQTFYNGDPIKHNLGLGGILTNDQDLFFRLVQSGRDTFNCVICCGSSFIMRRHAVEKVGGIPTETLCEDLLTSVKLQAAKYKVLYLNEALSAGASAENIGGYIDQRIRWGQGTLQTLFCSLNPLTMPGLNLVQRCFYLIGILGWLLTGLQIFSLFVPLGFLVLGLMPLKAQMNELLFFWLPYYLINLTVFAWLNGSKRSSLWADVYANITCFPLALMTVKTLINPFGKGFKVTPKGVDARGVAVNWQVAYPLIFTLGLYVIALAVHLFGLQWEGKPASPGFSIFWGIYNACVLAIAIQVAIDVPQEVLSLSFPHQLACQLILGDRIIDGNTVEISQKRAKIQLDSFPTNYPSDTISHIDIPFLELKTLALISLPNRTDKNGTKIEIEFVSLTLEQERRLIEFLFCRPGQWQETPVSEFKSFWALITSVFRLYPLAETQRVNSNAITTSIKS
ncbi:MAG: Cellulose synthase 1 [Chroococcidiopsis sp. SAG 2025]|uniref:glycosyltransferase n=1 Tax=Chroococcidiopsis sp. SAG 2025 TaxID=171389 RepID=UPI00293737F1|nr:glycosyltransferase [Chroococcidiopsis sp. SAG 2025]MDV2993461.1 Cellulose synthase 1 [Chroococcidiopsis sp. SAG 2025]